MLRTNHLSAAADRWFVLYFVFLRVCEAYNISCFESKKLLYNTCMKFLTPSIFSENITCAYSTVGYGDIAPFREKGDGLVDHLSDTILSNRDTFLSEIQITREQLVELKQFHTDKVVLVQNRDCGVGYIAVADAMITGQKGVALSIVTSDCLPVFFHDPVLDVLAVAHAGWRGVYAQIVPKTLTRMHSEYGSNPAGVLVWIGPHIAKDSYCFGESHFNDSPANEYFESLGGVDHKDGLFCVDLAHIVRTQLIKAGVLEKNIEVSDVDTKHDDRFYSYQNGDRTNNMGVIMMK